MYCCEGCCLALINQQHKHNHPNTIIYSLRYSYLIFNYYSLNMISAQSSEWQVCEITLWVLLTESSHKNLHMMTRIYHYSLCSVCCQGLYKVTSNFIRSTSIPVRAHGPRFHTYILLNFKYVADDVSVCARISNW